VLAVGPRSASGASDGSCGSRTPARGRQKRQPTVSGKKLAALGHGALGAEQDQRVLGQTTRPSAHREPAASSCPVSVALG
jgi:hypothetical protein